MFCHISGKYNSGWESTLSVRFNNASRHVRCHRDEKLTDSEHLSNSACTDPTRLLLPSLTILSLLGEMLADSHYEHLQGTSLLQLREVRWTTGFCSRHIDIHRVVDTATNEEDDHKDDD